MRHHAAHADNCAMRLVLTSLLALVVVPAALAANPHGQSIAGTISANSGAAITVTSADHSLTCHVPGAKAQAALAHWGVGVKAAMACTGSGDHLTLSRLTRLGSKEAAGAPGGDTGTTGTTGTSTRDGGTTPPPPPTTTGTGTGTTTTRHDSPPPPPPTTTTTTTHHEGTQPPPPPPPTTAPSTTSASPTPPPPPPATRAAHGLVTSLSSVAVTVQPDGGVESLSCRITPAADSTAAAAKLSLGARIAITCRRDGDSYVLSSATPIS
jgi:hypothetical protein